MRWQTKESLKELLVSLVEYQSITGSEDEVAVAEYIHRNLSFLPYFKHNTDMVKLHPLADGRSFVTALVKKPGVKRTVILLSHFDVVPVEDYGPWKQLAFRPDALTAEFYKYRSRLPDDVQRDLDEGEWLFGRGAMDMKAGAALHMSMVEKAAAGEFEGNVLMLSVPDEEVNSAGMIEAVPALVEMAKQHGLEYAVCLNSEPMFSRYPGDRAKYIYTGSVGKLLPGFFCYGKETHVGEPFSGLNSNYMASEISRILELNAAFCERVGDEATPPPVNLMQKDLKEEYSVQIPHASVALFNVMNMKRSGEDITNLLMQVARAAAHNIEDNFLRRARQFAGFQSYSPKPVKVQVFTYEALKQKAIDLYGKEEIHRRQNYLIANRHDAGDRDFTTILVHDLAALCNKEAPMIILFYSPPFYPAVSSADNPWIMDTVDELIEYSKKTYNIDFKHQYYFAGLSDLSFVQLKETEEGLRPLTENMPLFRNGYNLPIEALKALNVPVLNFGPLGRDAHQWTERLELSFSFGTLHELLSRTVARLLEKTP